MKYLGIDYGSKRVGVALSDADGKIAFPKKVLKRDKNLLRVLSEICKKEGVGAIVVGESKDLNGIDNPLQEKIMEFGFGLGKLTGLPVYYEPEFFSSAEAARVQGEGEMIDASAAAIILKSFLDKKNN